MREERLGENLWLRHLAQCKMQNSKCYMQLAKFRVRNLLLQYCVKRGWVRISGCAILPNRLSTSIPSAAAALCHSCLCLLLNVQGRFFATSLENPSNQKRILKGTYFMGQYGYQSDYAFSLPYLKHDLNIPPSPYSLKPKRNIPNISNIKKDCNVLLLINLSKLFQFA